MLKKLFFEEKGQSMVLFAVILTGLIAVTGIAVDGGRLYLAKSELQKAVDAGSLAGAKEMASETDEQLIKNKASEYAVKNFSTNEDTTISYAPEVLADNKVKVTGNANVKLFFFPIVSPGNHLGTVAEYAVAELTKKQTVSNSIWNYVLFSADPDFETKFTGSQDIIEGDVHINGDTVIQGNHHEFRGRFEHVGTIEGKDELAANKVQSELIDIITLDENIAEYKKKATKFFDSKHPFNINEITEDDIIFVDGDVQFNGANEIYKWTFLYVTGNIRITNSNSEFNGLFLAPGGTIENHAQGTTFKGSLIAHQIDTSNGSKNTFIYEGKYKDTLHIEYSIRLVE